MIKFANSNRRSLLVAALALGAFSLPASAQEAAPALFHITAPSLDVTIGLTAAEATALGRGSVSDLVAEQLVKDGRFSAWQYVVGRGPDGSLRHVTTHRIVLMRTDGMRIVPYAPALPVSPPPAS
jgi:hypothetical protein